MVEGFGDQNQNQHLDPTIEDVANSRAGLTQEENKPVERRLSANEIELAKSENSPMALEARYRDEFLTVGAMSHKVPKFDFDGNRVYEEVDGKTVPSYEKDTNGNFIIKSNIKWDSEVQYDIKRGLEVYDNWQSLENQRESVTVLSIVDDPDLNKLVDLILDEAIQDQATDILITQTEHFGMVRFTNGGSLWRNHRLLYKSSVDPIVTIIKHRAKMKVKLEDAAIPQINGAIKIGTTNFRLASGATDSGMFIELRQQSGFFRSLDDLDFPELIKSEIRHSFQARDGLTIVGGPVGSGKTTLQIAAMVELLQAKGGSLNMMSIEEPVEVDIPGINQISVNRALGVTWDNAMELMLRAKPSIVRIGETSNVDAAKAVVRASNDGTVVTTTMHLRSALEVFQTLKDYQISENDIKNTLRLVIYMNRVDKLCPHCRIETSTFMREDITNWINKNLNDNKTSGVSKVYFRNPNGCEICRANQKDPTKYGYLGKVGIYELAKVNKAFLMVWRRYSKEDVYVLKDKLMHPESIKYTDPDTGEIVDNADFTNAALNGLTYIPIEQDILKKLADGLIDYETAQYLLND